MAHVCRTFELSFMVKSNQVLKTSTSGKMCALLRRYRRSEGFESRTSLNFFQAFFSQLQKLLL